MSTIEVATSQWQFNRVRTLATLDQIAQLPQPQAVLGWRPGPGRAHIAWQLMHIAATEELFATERLIGAKPGSPELVTRFRGGSTPDDSIPPVEDIRGWLETSRAHLLATVARFSDGDLCNIPENLAERGWNVGTVLQVIAWHECHHQGQAHITLNLWKAGDHG